MTSEYDFDKFNRHAALERISNLESLNAQMYKIAEDHYNACQAGKCRRRWWRRDWALTIYGVLVGGGVIWALIWCARFIERGGR